LYEELAGTNPLDASDVPPDLDRDGMPDSEDNDIDGDSHDNHSDVFPLDNTEWSDIDKDGVGDNKDTDRDNDGFSNDVEIAANANDKDINDFPDTDNPIVELIQSMKPEHAKLLIRGIAFDDGMGIKSLEVHAKHLDKPIKATFTYNSHFQVSLPLEEGENDYEVILTDKKGNTASVKGSVIWEG
jgi:hypothetical protein